MKTDFVSYIAIMSLTMATLLSDYVPGILYVCYFPLLPKSVKLWKLVMFYQRKHHRLLNYMYKGLVNFRRKPAVPLMDVSIYCLLRNLHVILSYVIYKIMMKATRVLGIFMGCFERNGPRPVLLFLWNLPSIMRWCHLYNITGYWTKTSDLCY